MMPKQLIVASEELRDEVVPRLNNLQIKQVLAMYTPTGTSHLHPSVRHQLDPDASLPDLEERLSMADIQKIGKNKKANDEALLLETTHVFHLSSKELHYLELDDASNIAFPFEIKQKIHELVEEVP